MARSPFLLPHVVRSFGAFHEPGGIRSLSPRFARRLLLPPGPPLSFPTSSAPAGRSTCPRGSPSPLIVGGRGRLRPRRPPGIGPPSPPPSTSTAGPGGG